MNGRDGGSTDSCGGGLAVGLALGFLRRGCVGAGIAGGGEGLIDAESALLMVAGEATECGGGGRGDAGSSLRIWRSDMLDAVAGGDERAAERRQEVCEAKSEKCYVFPRV